MSHIPDLSPATLFSESQRLLAVGWLDRRHSFPRSRIGSPAYALLAEAVSNPWEPLSSRGYHVCNLCLIPRGPRRQRWGGRTIALGATNVWVAGQGHVFVAPSLILHYVKRHRYRPPSEFLSALLGSPKQGSTEHVEAIARNGPREFLVHVDPVLAEVDRTLRAISDHAWHPNPLANVEKLQALLERHSVVLGDDENIDRVLRRAARAILGRVPTDPTPHLDYPFVDRWKEVRAMATGALADAYRDPDAGRE